MLAYGLAVKEGVGVADNAGGAMPALVQGYTRWAALFERGGVLARYGLAGGSTALVTAILSSSGLAVEPANISLIYLLAVLFTAVSAGVGPGVAASASSFLLYNFFFVEPLYVLTVNNPQDVARLVSFLLVALIASGFAGIVRHQAEELTQRAAQLRALYDLSQATSTAVTPEQIVPAFARTMAEILPVAAGTIVVNHTTFAMPSQSNYAPSPEGITAPLYVNRHRIGELAVWPQVGQTLGPTERRLLDTLAGQLALALERARLVEQETTAQVLAESDRLKSALLLSVSHDLRTPLAAIIGAATELQRMTATAGDGQGPAFAETVVAEAMRLDHLVGSMLAMARIEGGALNPARAWEDIGEIIGVTLRHLRPQLPDHVLQTRLPPNLPLVWVNAGLIDQVLTNLIENSGKYSPRGSVIALSARVADDELRVVVADRGPGIPPAALPHIFDAFFRVVGPERHADGAGLGLAICAGIVAAHAGRIWAENPADGGARFTLALPLHPVGADQEPKEGDDTL